MSYSRRQLEALGEPLGESVTRKEGGRIIYGGGGGGGGGGGTQTQVVELPDWAKPAAQDVLARGEVLSKRDYTPYGGERIAGFKPLQQQAFGAAQQLGPSAATGMGMGIAGAAANRAMDMGYNPMQAVNQYQGVGDYAPADFQNRFAAPGMYQAGQFSTDRVFGPQLERFQMGPAERVRADMFGGRQAAQYMSPYIEQALEPQLREAQRSSEMQRNASQAQAVQQGAFGGSRQAIIEAERQRNLGTQMGDIRARGLQTAYEQASQQFNQDAARRLQAQQLNQQAGLTVGGQNLQAALGTQQLGAQTGLQAALANQQQAMEAQRLAEQSRQFGAGQGLTAAQLQAQYGLSADQAGEASRQFAANQAAQQAQQRAQFGQSAQQLAEQSRQFGAGFGMQGIQAALQGAGQLGALGQQQFGQQKEAIGLQSQLGGQQQALDQQRMSQQYQDFLNQQRHPYQQLEFMSNLIRGTPMGTVQSMYAAQPTMAQNLGALGMGAYGIGQLMRAEGGTVSSYAEGGSVTDEQNVDNILDKLSDAQLYQARDMAMSRKDAAQVAQIDQELAQRASIRSGLGNAFNAIPQERQEQMMAGGGVVAFAGDEDENDEDTGQQVSDRIPVGRGDPTVYGQSMAGLTALQAKMARDQGYSPLTAAEEKAMYDRSTARGKEIYGGLLDKIKADIATQRGESAESLREGRGLAALQAAAAMTQGRGLAQGLGRAGGAFAGAYGQALRSDREQKRALSAMDLNLAKAESEQLMGLHDKAEAQIAKANANREKAHTAGVRRDRAMADILYKSGRLAMPPAPTKTGAPKPLKLAEQLAAAEIAHETNPTAATLANVNALRRAMDRARTSDFGPTRAGLTESSLDVRLGDAITEAQQKIKFTPDYLKADAAGKQKMLQDAAAQVRANASRGAGVNINSPQKGGTRLQFDAEGNLLPG